jgi:hypothetical protein
MPVFPLRTVVCAVWLLAIGVAGTAMFRYESAAGRAGETPETWPSNTKVPLSQSKPTLLMFAHPKCPCTRASIEQLNQLLGRQSERVATRVLFFEPAGFDSNWTRTSSWEAVSRIPSVNVLTDLDGEEARRFGAETSGYVLLFNPRGQLLFRGGITAGRGQAGDNAGVQLIASALAGSSLKTKQTPVYGCSLLGECGVANKGDSTQ